jgi:uncharacterized protein (TIGR02996 family)
MSTNPTSTTRQAFEAALSEAPDDLATHMAYADWLREQGDPRGEFIQVQLALEDETRPPQEREQLRAREAELLGAHEREWVGDLAASLFEKHASEDIRQRNHGRWARGWLSELSLWWFDLETARALVRCPVARLLRQFRLDHVSIHDHEHVAQLEDGVPEGSENPTFYPLQKAPFLPHLRVLQVGETVDFEDENYDSGHTNAEGVASLIPTTTQLEELYLLARDVKMQELFAQPSLARLRVLQVYHCANDYPVSVLAANPALGRLTTLRLHPAFSDRETFLRRDEVRALFHSPHLPSLINLHLHGCDLGDEGCVDIVESGILKRLKVLDLRHGCITDEGARTLAACPDIKRLELLSLENNELTDVGRELLNGIGIPVRCTSQNEPGEDQYLWSGDME